MEFKTMEEWDAVDAARPWWKRVAEDVVLTVEAKADVVRFEAKMRWQKLTTGTNQLEWTNIDEWLPMALAMRLRIMAERTKSYPPDWTHEDWVDHLNDLATDLEGVQEFGEYEELHMVRAKNSLHWIADNLEMLWS